MDKRATLQDMGEFKLHQRIQELLGIPSSEVWVGIGDDAAVIQPQTRPIVLTNDTMVEGVHFMTAWTTAAELAYKILATNISDLAAKGALPAYGLISLGLPHKTHVEWVDAFYKTLSELVPVWHLEIIGGDTVRSPNITVSLTALGYQIPPNPIRINSAQVGDWILVTGTLGDAAAGLEILQKNPHCLDDQNHLFLVERFKKPLPRLDEAIQIVKDFQPSSMSDISDGLARDLPKICKASGAGARVIAKDLPLSKALSVYAEDPILLAWIGGEDYELVLTLPPGQADSLLQKWDQSICSLKKIGEITPLEEGIQLVGRENLETAGYDHFS